MPYVEQSVFTRAQMKLALETAREASTENGKSRGGWVRLTRVQGSAADPYVVAVRELKDGRIQFGCDCAHWKFRCNKAGNLCKHQQASLTGGHPKPGAPLHVWWYKAGEAFVSCLKGTTEGEVS